VNGYNMRLLLIKCLTAWWVFAPVVAGAASYNDYGDASPEGQLALELINRARMDPVGEAARQGIDLYEGVEPGEISDKPVQPLAMNALLIQAAGLHSGEMLDNNYFAHDSLDGSSPWDRITAAGYDWYTVGENIAGRFYSSCSMAVQAVVEQMHSDLFVDLEYPGRGHRVNMLKPDFREAGIGIAKGEYVFNGRMYPCSYLETTDFGLGSGNSGPFVLGVVFTDLDHDGEYDIGEGRGGVTISVQGTDAYTVTASAGGFAISVDTGNYRLVADASFLNGSLIRDIDVGDQNVKVDFCLSTQAGQGDEPPAYHNVGMCDTTCQAGAPMTVAGGAMGVNFNYTAPVEVIAGVMSSDFTSVWWLTGSCTLPTDFAQAASNAGQFSCTNVAMPPGSDHGLIKNPLFWTRSSTES